MLLIGGSGASGIVFALRAGELQEVLIELYQPVCSSKPAYQLSRILLAQDAARADQLAASGGQGRRLIVKHRHDAPPCPLSRGKQQEMPEPGTLPEAAFSLAHGAIRRNQRGRAGCILFIAEQASIPARVANKMLRRLGCQQEIAIVEILLGPEETTKLQTAAGKERGSREAVKTAGLIGEVRVYREGIEDRKVMVEIHAQV